MSRVPFAALAVALALPGGAHAHRVRVTAPAQFDVAVAQVRYAVPHGPRAGLKVALAAPAGLDYVAVALPRHQPRRALVALVAVVNRRPQGSAAPDVGRIALSLRPARATHPPKVSQATNVLYAAPATTPALCAVGPLTAGDLRFALRAGAPPQGFGARSTIAQVLAAACGRQVDPAFRAAVAPPALPGPPKPEPTPCPPCPRYPPAGPRIICPAAAPPAACPDAA
jgi:hypothetical protein